MTKSTTAKKATSKKATATKTKNSLRRKVSTTGKDSKVEKSSVKFTGNNVKLSKSELIKEIKPAKYVTPFQRQNTKSANGKTQQRSCGSRTTKNAYGHFIGTIGAKIDTMIEHGNFTKKEIENYAGTKMSKVNAHINHLRKDRGLTVNTPRNGIVSFG